MRTLGVDLGWFPAWSGRLEWPVDSVAAPRITAVHACGSLLIVAIARATNTYLSSMRLIRGPEGNQSVVADLGSAVQSVVDVFDSSNPTHVVARYETRGIVSYILDGGLIVVSSGSGFNSGTRVSVLKMQLGDLGSCGPKETRNAPE